MGAWPPDSFMMISRIYPPASGAAADGARSKDVGPAAEPRGGAAYSRCPYSLLGIPVVHPPRFGPGNTTRRNGLDAQRSYQLRANPRED